MGKTTAAAAEVDPNEGGSSSTSQAPPPSGRWLPFSSSRGGEEELGRLDEEEEEISEEEQVGGGGRLCSRWAAALGPTVDALVTSVHGGGATAAGVLPNSRSRVAGHGAPGLRPGMREGRRVEPTVSRGIAACRGVAAEEQLGGGEARLRSAAKQGRCKMAAAGQVCGGASGTSSWLILRRLGHAVPVGNRGRRRLGRARCRRASREEEGRLARDLK
ncbi:uncharacterized protein [Triticum aestivum]|uniref:uncharacterized protein n=1 Tax=Triticum aestivum TaxID=4565 RepID=UPI001D026DAA|nr:uncharacterized protein LOC123148104 [Triticum aestivum]